MAPKLSTLLLCGLAGLAGRAAAQSTGLNGTWELDTDNVSGIAGTSDSLLGASASSTGGFDMGDAVTMAYLSTAAMCSDTINTWTCGLPCLSVPGVTNVRQINDQSHGAHGYVGRLDGQCVAVFRGTSDAVGWIHDLMSVVQVPMPGCNYQGSRCMVGSGFLLQWQALSTLLKSQLADIGCTPKDPLMITGHSLGAAVATLAFVDLVNSGWYVSKAYTFGGPRVGDDVFVKAFEQALQSQGGRSTFSRVALASDPVVYLPPPGSFRHVGPEVFFGNNFNMATSICAQGESDSCAGQIDPISLTILLAKCADKPSCGHLMYMEPSKRGPMSGQSCGASLNAFPQQLVVLP